MSASAYKLVDRQEWEAARAVGAYGGSDVDRADGFIHMSTAGQLPETVRRHYSGRSALVLVEVDLDVLGPTLKWDVSRGGDRFPHIYGPLPVSAARRERALCVDGQGVMSFEDGQPAWG